MTAFWVTQASSLKCNQQVNGGLFKCLIENNNSFKKDKEKLVLLQAWRYLQGKNLISSSGLKRLCACFYHAPNILLGKILYMKTIM